MGRDKKAAGLFLGSNGVAALTAERQGNKWLLTGFGSAYGAEKAAGKNFLDHARAAVSSAGIKKGGVSLSIPDTFACAVILDFEEFPKKKDEADEIVRLKAGKFLNSNLMDSTLSYDILSRGEAVKVLTVVVKKELINGLEEGFSNLGLNVERISLHSLNLLNLFFEDWDRGKDFSVILLIDNYFTVMVFRGGVLDYYRCREVEWEGDEFAREIASSFLSYRGKRPDISIKNICLFDAKGGYDELVKNILALDVVSIDVASVLSTSAFSLEGEAPIALLAALGAAI